MLGQSVFNVALLKGVFTTTSRFQTISFDSDAVTVQTVDNTKKTPMVVPKKIDENDDVRLHGGKVLD